MVYDNRHSRLVALAKLVLPLAALALLSTLFLVSERVDPSLASLYADVDVDELAREQRIGTPQFAGMTEDGAAVMVRASAALPDVDATGATARDMVARIEAKDGLSADIIAKTGRIDPAGGQVLLSGGVAMQTSTGYRMHTPEMTLRTDRSRVTAPAKVRAEAPFGTIDAGAMELSRPSAETPYDLAFKDGVKLIYQPQE
ncbi:LPS export ABC transporter periplasmic protein LptC [Paenirhodobacter sp.]|uniref:LPS export ABC transporter periplasmic protein LptC n=1 Tax=Paenirhodobacter sp. TaxID=1965326 RepID=UPI003B4102C6